MVTFFMPNDITFQSNKPNLVITLEGEGGGEWGTLIKKVKITQVKI
jgi:hypothetical protein